MVVSGPTWLRFRVGDEIGMDSISATMVAMSGISLDCRVSCPWSGDVRLVSVPWSIAVISGDWGFFAASSTSCTVPLEWCARQDFRPKTAAPTAKKIRNSTRIACPAR